MPRRIQVPALALIPLLLAACAQEVETPRPPEHAGLFTLGTALGPVDVLAFGDDPAGAREVRVHAVLPDGRHAVRTLRLAVEETPATITASRTVYTVYTEGVERVRVTRVEGETGVFEAVFEAGGERMRMIAGREVDGIRFRVLLDRDGVERTWETRLDPGRGRDAVYAGGVRESLRTFYGEGPLAGNEDLALLVAVLESPDWAEHLVEVPLDPAGVDPATERRIRQVCVGAAVTSKISCFISRFTPWGMIACVPATGISLACLIYNVAQIATNPDPAPCACACRCGA